MADCLRCRGKMTEGFAYIQSDGGALRWIDGEKGLWAQVAAPEPAHENSVGIIDYRLRRYPGG